MKDLAKLCTRHIIEARLYNGDAIDKIYYIMGDGRVTRWFSSIYDAKLDEEAKWGRLINFLEKELHIQQQKMLISRKSDTKLQDDKMMKGGKYSHFVDDFDDSADENQSQSYNVNTNQHLTCSFCGETGHVPTMGPRGKKLIQYFSC